MTNHLPPLFTELLAEKKAAHPLYKQALTHRSFSKDHNERLEYLGDAVLDLLIGESLYQSMENADEGLLSRYRAELVKGERLATIAKSIDLGAMLRFGTGEKKTGGANRHSNLAGAFEAVVGAIYLDLGYETCKHYVMPLFQVLIDDVEQMAKHKDAKTALQEWLQAKQYDLPVYHVVKISGAQHQQTFTVELVVKALNSSVQATAASKKLAQQAAAEKMLAVIDKKEV